MSNIEFSNLEVARVAHSLEKAWLQEWPADPLRFGWNDKNILDNIRFLREYNWRQSWILGLNEVDTDVITALSKSGFSYFLPRFVFCVLSAFDKGRMTDSNFIDRFSFAIELGDSKVQGFERDELMFPELVEALKMVCCLQEKNELNIFEEDFCQFLNRKNP